MISYETVLVPVQRITMDGRHVCTPDLRSSLERCPMLDMLSCGALPGERLPGDGLVILPHSACPLAGLDAIERGRYMRGLIAGMCGKARPSSISGMQGWDAAMDGKRFAERNGLDVLEESES